MNHNLVCRIIGSILLVFLIGFCVADDGPSYQVFIQGGESSIASGSNGAHIITVKDIVPYFYISDGEKDWLTPVDRLNNLTYPINAALVLSNENKRTIMVRIANLSLSDEDKILTLQVNPLSYYEGKYLQRFYDQRLELETLGESNHSRAAIYLEMKQNRPLNSGCHAWCSDGVDSFCCHPFFPFP